MENNMRSRKRKTQTENDLQTAEVVKYVKALFKAARASAAPPLQLLRFTAICLTSVLAGPLRSLASGAHVSGLLSKIDEPGNGDERRAPNPYAHSFKGQI
jgi:hypothetical protein